MSAEVTRSGLSLWQQLKEAAVPVVMYHLLMLFSLASFCGVVICGGHGFSGRDNRDRHADGPGHGVPAHSHVGGDRGGRRVLGPRVRVGAGDQRGAR